MLNFKHTNFSVEAGTDEAGRGCLAGPVTAAAIITSENLHSELLNDSKQTSLKVRNFLRKWIEENENAYAVAHIWPEEIDQINILNASIKAMHHALDKLSLTPDFIIVDGNRFKSYKNIPHETIVKGDGKYLSIAAASVLAKTYRDEIMLQLHEEYPMYHWNKNKGYPTKEHRDAIIKYGACKYHRKSFRLIPEQLKLDL